jgi:cytoskeleton protein RodZ
MKELGEYLKAERLRQRVELATITEKTCISRSMLIALEEGDSERIETPLLVRSFTRAYCRVLGLDPVVVLERYTGETPRHERLDEGIRHYRERSRAVRERARLRLFFLVFATLTIAGVYITTVWLPKREPGPLELSQQTAMEGQTTADEQLKAEREASLTHDQGVKADAVSGGVQENRGEAGVPEQSGPTAEAGKQPGEVRATVPKDSPAEKVPGGASAAQQGHRLRVEATVETWVEVRLDDKKVEGVLLHAGESREWQVQKGLRLLMGNATGAKVTWDGKAVKNLGKPGQAVRLRLPEDVAKR